MTYYNLTKIAASLKGFDPRSLKRPAYLFHEGTGRFTDAELLNDFMRKGAPSPESLGSYAQAMAPTMNIVDKAPLGKLLAHMHKK